jgi:multidrug efflux pump subunit AcrB
VTTAAPGGGDLVRLFARHPTAGNLLMAVMILLGLIALTKLNRQFLPDFGIDVISVTVEWPGATAQDVEESIIEALEPDLRFIDGVDKVRGTASEGQGTVAIEFQPGTDLQRALSDVESAVAQVTTLPEDSERPRIRRIFRYDTIARLVLSGPYDERALKGFAKRIREDLLARGVDRVTFFGLRDEEIRVETAPETLRRLDLTMDELAGAIERASQDLPAGDFGGAFDRQPRALGLARSAEEIAAIEVRATPSGHKLRVGDLAEVTDGFDPDAPEGRRGGVRAIELHVERTLANDALQVADAVDAYLAQLPEALPANVHVEVYDVAADLIRERIDLLLRNGLSGLILVLAILFFFLNARVAFWVAAGIPISLLAMLGILWLNDQSINMISLFAMILAIGIVVDDAIVVGEHTAALYEQGVGPQVAAEEGALGMAAPVTAASLTTIASFLPILVVGDIIGQVIREIPLVVIAVLVASLIECFFVLPCHLRGALAALGPSSWLRRAANRGFERLRDRHFRRVVETALAWRYTTLAGALGALILALGLIAGGRVGFVFFPAASEAIIVYANLVMAPGTSRAATERTLAAMDEALHATERDLGAEPGELVVMSFVQLGETLIIDPRIRRLNGDNVGALHVQLVGSDGRAVRTEAFIEAWHEHLPPLPGVEALTITPRLGGPPGRELDIRLRGGDSLDDLKRASHAVRDLLARLPGLSQIDDDLPYGKQEILVELTSRGRALGFSTESVGQQLRDAFEGRIAKRFARGDEEVEVVVSLAESAASGLSVAQFPLRGPTGLEVPLGEVADLRDERGFATIRREDGVRDVAVTAELDETQIRLEQVIAALTEAGLPAIAERHGLTYDFAGRAEEQTRTLADIRVGAVLALLLIYIILAWVFASFTRPLAVMLIIPFGLIGAVLGHLLLGYDLSILSLITLLGLSGILVNDSIILVTAIDRRCAEGMALERAVVDGTCARLRAVILTSGTTIGSLAPLLFETSFQAQFLLPMAITIVFGLMVTTFLVLLLVPAMIGVQADLGALRRRLAQPRPAPAQEQAPSAARAAAHQLVPPSLPG